MIPRDWKPENECDCDVCLAFWCGVDQVNFETNQLVEIAGRMAMPYSVKDEVDGIRLGMKDRVPERNDRSFGKTL